MKNKALFLGLFMLGATLGCGDDGVGDDDDDVPDDGGQRSDAGGLDGGTDSGPMLVPTGGDCTEDEQCEGGICMPLMYCSLECTIPTEVECPEGREWRCVEDRDNGRNVCVSIPPP